MTVRLPPSRKDDFLFLVKGVRFLRKAPAGFFSTLAGRFKIEWRTNAASLERAPTNANLGFCGMPRTRSWVLHQVFHSDFVHQGWKAALARTTLGITF